MGHMPSAGNLAILGSTPQLMNSAFCSLGSSVLHQLRLATGSPRVGILSHGISESKNHRIVELEFCSHRITALIISEVKAQDSKKHPIYQTHRINGETKAQRGHVTCPR